jgi:hypothetical protein
MIRQLADSPECGIDIDFLKKELGEERFFEESASSRPLNRAQMITILDVALPGAIIYDCRQLPFAFVMDTAEAYLTEPPAERGPVMMPNFINYFEFSEQLGIMTLGTKEVASIRFFGVRSPFTTTEQGTKGPVFVYGRFPNHLCEGCGRPDHHDVIEPLGGGGSDMVAEYSHYTMLSGKAVLGALALMRDKLIASEFVVDPKPWVNRERQRNHKPPLSAPTTILTINVGAVRRRVKQDSRNVMKHESPALHWRTGHWRTLHRYSEFEKRVWVKRCLVGDPAHGYVGHRDFRLIWQQDYIPATKTAIEL